MKISFVGSGNVAWHLAQAFEYAGHMICEVYSRDSQHSRQLAASLYDTAIQPDLNFSESEADLIVIAAPDDALESVMQRIVLPEDVIVVNTSGTKSLAEIQNLIEIYSDVHVHTGVFYPLQTFTKGIAMDYKNLPLCIESTNEQIEARLMKLGQSVSNNVRRIDSEERFILHVAAVFANNFTNYLLGVSHDLLSREQLNFDLLKPLIKTTIDKAMLIGDPATGQTGPARRGDWITTAKHLEFLQEIDPELADVYRLLTAQIRSRHAGNQ